MKKYVWFALVAMLTSVVPAQAADPKKVVAPSMGVSAAAVFTGRQESIGRACVTCVAPWNGWPSARTASREDHWAAPLNGARTVTDS